MKKPWTIEYAKDDDGWVRIFEGEKVVVFFDNVEDHKQNYKTAKLIVKAVNQYRGL